MDQSAHNTSPEGTPLEALHLTTRAHQALLRAGIETVEQALFLSDTELLIEIREKLDGYLNQHAAALTTPHAPRAREETKQVQLLDVSPIANLGLSTRSYNALKRAGISTIAQLSAMSEEQIRAVRSIGEKSAAEIQRRLAHYVDQLSSPLIPPPIVSEILESIGDIPLDDIPIARLVLSPIEAKRLSTLKIDSLGELIRELVRAQLIAPSIADRLNQYLDWLIDQDEEIWDIESSGERASPIHRLILDEATLDELIKTWTRFLTLRERDIIKQRMGWGGLKATLAEIGEQMRISRERIRQLETKALLRLSEPEVQMAIAPLVQCLVQEFADAGGLMTEEEVQGRIVELIRVESVDVGWAARLLLTVRDEFQEVTKDCLWGLASVSLELAPQVREVLLDLLQDIGGLVPPTLLWERFKETAFHQEHRLKYEDGFIEACLRTDPKIGFVEGMYMARERGIEAGAVQAVREESGPRPQPQPSKPELTIDLEGVEASERPDPNSEASLDDWEGFLRSSVARVELLGEIALTDEERVQIGQIIGLHVQALGYSRAVRTLRSKYPCTLTVYLVAQGVYGYEGGDYWSDVIEATGFKHPYVSKVGRAFEEILEALELPLFYDMRAEAHRYVSLILAHGGIPNYCLPDFFAKMLQPSVVRAKYVDMSAAELIDEWLWQRSIVQFTDKPVTRFLKYGGRVAEDFVERCREMAWAYVDSGTVPGPKEVGLPQRVTASYEEWIVAQDVEHVVQDKGDRWRLRKPQVLVDPWGEGVLIDLPPQQAPATDIYAAIEWQVRADGNLTRVPVHVRRRGFDRKTEAEVLPLTRPAERLEVSLIVDGKAKRAWRYQPIDEKHPLLVFDPERGKLLSWTLSLPAGPLGILYPAGCELQVEGDGRLVEELPRLPWGWAAFRGEIWDLTQATRLILSGDGEEELEVAVRPDQVVQAPSLEGGQMFSPKSSPEGGTSRVPVYVGAPPHVRVPLTGRQKLDDELARWQIRVRNEWTADPEVDVKAALIELKPDLIITDQYFELPLGLPSLLGASPRGNFSVRLRGPLGRDAAFTLRMLPHFVLCGHEELYLPTAQDGPGPATLLAETLPEDRIECQGDEAACRVRVIERGEAVWHHEIEVGPNTTDLELTVIHPHPSGEAVRVPIHAPIRRLRWALVDEETAARRGVWSGSIIKRPIEALKQLRSPFLLIKLPLQDTDRVQLEVRLLDDVGEELQATDRMTLIGGRLSDLIERVDLSAFLDTIRASRSPILRLELTIWGLPGQDAPLRLPVLSLTRTLLVENAALSCRVMDHRVVFDLRWDEAVPLKNRHVRFWPLWRPWDTVFEQPIPDEAEGEISFEVDPEKLRSGKYRLEFLVVDPWTAGNETPRQPRRGAPSTADVEMIEAERQLEILDARVQEGTKFETLLERAAVYQDIGAPEKAAPDRKWCYQHLDDGEMPQVLALIDLAQDAEDDSLTRALQLKLFAARRVERLLAMREAGELSQDLFEAYLGHLPRSGMLPLTTCEQLLTVEDETIRLHTVQQLIRRSSLSGPETVIRWVEEAELSDADATALLMLNIEFSAEVLKKRLESPAAMRLLKALAPDLGDKTPVVQAGTWIYTDVGWGRIERIENRDGDKVQQFLSEQNDFRLHVILRPALDAEPVLIDLKRKLITFTEADVIYTCSKCKAFSTQDPHVVMDRHDRIAHDGIGLSYRTEKINKRSLRKLKYRARPPLKQGLGTPETSR